MAGFAKKFESAKQEWTTPDDVFDPINAEFGFTLDAAADAANARAPKFFSAANNGLRQDWGIHTVWVNPPMGSAPENFRIGSKSHWTLRAREQPSSC